MKLIEMRASFLNLIDEATVVRGGGYIPLPGKEFEVDAMHSVLEADLNDLLNSLKENNTIIEGCMMACKTFNHELGDEDFEFDIDPAPELGS